MPELVRALAEMIRALVHSKVKARNNTLLSMAMARWLTSLSVQTEPPLAQQRCYQYSWLLGCRESRCSAHNCSKFLGLFLALGLLQPTAISLCAPRPGNAANTRV